MSWKIEFYDNKVKEAIGGWPVRMRAKFTWIAELIEAVGPNELGMPHIKPLGQGLFEIRVKSDEGIGRAPFCIMKNQVVIVLSEFIKKTQKASAKEIERARFRMKEVKNNE